VSIIASHVGKVIGQPPTRVLQDISLEIRDGEFIALTGRSGSGKSTLLYLLSSLDTTYEGSIEIDGRELKQMTEEELAVFRNRNMGFVFQFHYLLAELSALENVLMPARKAKSEDERRERAVSLLAQFGLGEKLHRLPRELSGGEQQRVAIARALVMDPRYLFADEPTGNLDSVSGEMVMQIIRNLNEKLGMTIVMVTHDPDFANLAKRKIHLSDGRVVRS
jgi:putative ABC transport system ATP-binding protein/lipoprotein-releasing system ATP-binding protein